MSDRLPRATAAQMLRAPHTIGWEEAMARDAVTLFLADEKDAPAPDSEKAIFATVTVDGPEKIPA